MKNLASNREKKINETPDNKDQENVCIYPPLLMENRISNIPVLQIIKLVLIEIPV